MAELILEPYAGHLHWSLPDGVEPIKWERLLAGFVDALARGCEQEEQCLIGHIKGLSTFSESRFVQVNAVSSDHAAEVTGAAPQDCRELTFTLNALVYGITYNRLSHLVEASAGETAAAWGAEVTVESAHSDHHQAHDHS